MILLYIVIACFLLVIVCMIVMSVCIRKKVDKQMQTLELEAISISKKHYDSLNLSQKYALLFVFDIFQETIRGSVTNLAVAHHQIELEARALGVKVEDSDAYFKDMGMEQGYDRAMSILADIKEKNKVIVDFLIYRSNTLVHLAGGTNKQYCMSNKEIATNLFYRMYGSLGYTDNQLDDIIENPDELINIFGRTKLVK